MTTARTKAINPNVNNLKVAIETGIKDLKTSEQTTRKLLSILSRDMLLYVPDTGDIGMVNRLLAATTTANRDHALLFFQAFLPWKVTTARTFGEKITGTKLVAKKMADIAVFLADEKNDIWSWSRENIQPAQRVVKYDMAIANAVERALDPTKGHMTPADVIAAIRKGGVSIADILIMAEAMEETISTILVPDDKGEKPAITPDIEEKAIEALVVEAHKHQPPAPEHNEQGEHNRRASVDEKASPETLVTEPVLPEEKPKATRKSAPKPKQAA